MAVTQGDVAKRAGVARRTVSNVVNDFPYVSDDVRVRVQEAIRELGYQPNQAAQRLRTGRSGTIGLILPELDVGYFAEIGRLLVEEFESRGYTVLVAQTLGIEERELEALDKFVSQQPEGLLFSPISVSAEQLRPYLDRFPVVLLGEQLDPSTADHVTVDNEAASRAVVEVMLDRGRRRIAFIGDNPIAMADLRRRGYSAALGAHDIPVDPQLLVRVDGYHRSQGYDAVTRLVESGIDFDGVFCANDLLAIGAIRALLDLGRRVPDDVSVVGFDDIDETRYTVPRLTTVAPDKASIAEEAVQMLIDRIADPGRERAKTTKAFSIAARDSV
ncbi:LacI family DNA-binding transcriptional regulator [Galbitalea sp. SE-J8]|uniref:LacI family DNA-binding transcriptional regulator n=1 Tax=Galbitalea sp. SE-J8 TaxID=3054952 RepID=UPI00259CD07C|nr:LacI family DNA-binding transcriptional regulator [Galbitalea sp. SE-J8]MDM4761661.1 LacI family DNA-binding transcriptional regulator [Galbitalea sp. SE-J8]